MDRKAWRRVFSAWLLSCTAAFGAVGCLMSGMRLEGSIFWLIVGCAVMAFVFSFCFEKSRLTLVPFCAVALLIGLWWYEGTLRYSVEGMVYSISNLYDLGYGWGVVQWSDWHMLNPDATPALLLVALPVVISVSVTTVYGQMGLLGSGVAMVPLLLCVVLKDTAPSPVYHRHLLCSRR